MANFIDGGTTQASTFAAAQDLIDRVRDLISESNADYYDDPEILGYLNEGKHRMFGFLDVIPTSYTASLVAGQAAYTVPSLVNRWLWMNVGTTPLKPVNSREFAALMVNPTTGTPTHYCPEFTDASGGNQVMVFPTPATSDSTPSMSGYYYGEPANLSDSQGPTWHAQYHMLPCYYAASILLRKDRLHETAEAMEARFNAGVEEYRVWYERKFPLRFEATQPVSGGISDLAHDAMCPWEVGP